MGLLARFRSNKRAMASRGQALYFDDLFGAEGADSSDQQTPPGAGERAPAGSASNPDESAAFRYRNGLPVSYPSPIAAPAAPAAIDDRASRAPIDGSAHHHPVEADPDAASAGIPVEQALTPDPHLGEMAAVTPVGLSVQLPPPPPPAVASESPHTPSPEGTEVDAWLKALERALALAQAEDASDQWADAVQAATVILEMARARAARAEANEQADEQGRIAQVATEAADAAKAEAERTAKVADDMAEAARSAMAAADAAKHEAERAAHAVPVAAEAARSAVRAASEAKRKAQALEEAVTKARAMNTADGWATVLRVRNDDEPEDSTTNGSQPTSPSRDN